MAEIPFVTPLADPRYGEVVPLSPLVRRVIANNPNKFSYTGTGTYIIGHGDVAVIDPGPTIESHQDALRVALEGSRVRAILVTHCHSDHSPLAAWLKEYTGAPTIGFGPHGEVGEPDPDDVDDEPDDEPENDAAASEALDPAGAAVSAAVSAAAAAGEVESKESTDVGFVPDIAARDGSIVARGLRWTMRAVHTPGHTSNHMCFTLDEESALFTGDHVMGWSTTVVSPPDGDMRAYMSSLAKVSARRDATLYPTHGNPIKDPQPFLAAYAAHRLAREAQVFAQIQAGVPSIRAMVKVLYANVDKGLHKAAARSVLSHVIKLVDDGRVAVEGGGQAKAKASYHVV